ncbi:MULTISPECIES: hypothetical protein [Muribaculaceae]|uniref:hypothetical protein n=1 Tax=Muribaculaceae TaxID=2005473 RepID=UPI00264A1813|nr:MULTISPECIES: hypothetical protein [Muribaculaceae]
MNDKYKNENMELKEFIKTAIADVTNAISELQVELENGTIVNPTLPTPIANTTLPVDGENRQIERLDFDVAVTASDASQIDGGAKAGISVFGAKIGTKSSAEEQRVSRLTFSIPVVFPTVHVKTPMEMLRENRFKRPQYED